MKGFTYSTARGWEAHQDTCPCCISGSGSLGPHKLFLHWRDEGYHMCGTAASAPHYMSGIYLSLQTRRKTVTYSLKASKNPSWEKLEQLVGQDLAHPVHCSNTLFTPK